MHLCADLQMHAPQTCAQVFDHPALKRAKMSVAKRGNFVPRQKMFLGRCAGGAARWVMAARCAAAREKLEAVVAFCSKSKELECFAWLFIVTYAFLLRMPSEALPIVIGAGPGQAVLALSGDELTLRLERRQVGECVWHWCVRVRSGS